MVPFVETPSRDHDGVVTLMLRPQRTEYSRIHPIARACRNRMQVGMEMFEEPIVSRVGRHNDHLVFAKTGKRQELEIYITRPAGFEYQNIALQDGTHVHATAKGIEAIRVFEQESA